jgi:neutral ceramidase
MPPAAVFRAGAAGINVDPPLGLPMIGVVRRAETAADRLGPLEVTAAAFESGETRVIVCGVDTAAIQAPEVDAIRARIAEATGAALPGILLNWNHTHHAPPGGRSIYGSFGEREPTMVDATLAYIDRLHDAIVEACRLACERLEPAWVRWGLGHLDEAINRRERDPDGRVTRIGWNPDGLVDLSVPTLQATRPNGSAIVTLVGYGCHTVTTGVEYIGYSPDYPGPMRDLVRTVTGGECVFLQGAAGNVMPRYAFDDENLAPARLGRRLALEALHAVDGGSAWPSKLVETGFGSGTPLTLFRDELIEAEPPALAAREASVDFPLQTLPTLGEITAFREQAEQELRDAEARGATESELRILRFHGANWARRTEAEVASGNPRTFVTGVVNAIRIGDGAIVSGPGEIFTEIGLAVKERAPADVTLYAGYSNGLVSYMPTAAEYPLGGYEPTYGNKSYGLPAQVSPETERLLVETGVRLVRELFPERAGTGPDGWLATGALPEPPPTPRPVRP